MKRLECFSLTCNERRVHHERPDELRPRQKIEVPDNYEGPVWCSLTCMILDPKSGHSVKGFDPSKDKYLDQYPEYRKRMFKEKE